MAQRFPARLRLPSTVEKYSSMVEEICLLSKQARNRAGVQIPPSPPYAGVAQWEEQPPCKRQVVGSNPISGTNGRKHRTRKNTDGIIKRIVNTPVLVDFAKAAGGIP